jgi:hypothetical protein
MKRFPCLFSLVLMPFALLGPAARPAAAQQVSQLVPLKMIVKAPLPTPFPIPGSPLTASVHLSSTGESEFLGAFAWIDHHVARFGVDGVPTAVTGDDAFVASNGDAIYITFVGLLRQGGLASESAFFVKGGSGRFSGAVGSGRQTAVVDPEKKEVTFTYDGLISPARK